MTTSGSDVILERMMTLHPKVIDLTLDRVERLLATLGHPERRMPPVVHVAGTNGKGSTVAMIRAGLEATGARCHVYTSPHLARFHERIRLAGSIITEAHLTEVLDRAMAVNGTAPITYFEITTCAAFLAMAETPAEWTLLEVGLGGRLDATNVVERPEVTVITPVDLDHQAFLGDTVSLIAGEKAGIMKRGVPCVVAPQHAQAMEVIENHAARTGSPLVAHGQHWNVGVERGRLVFQDEDGLLDLPLPNLLGPHQIVNAGSALAALRVHKAPEIAYEAAVTRAEWPARMQRLTEGALARLAAPCELWLDGGHNPAAGAMIAATLRERGDRPVHVICGMLNTKDIAGFMRHLTGVARTLTAVSIPGEKNTIPADETARIATEAGLSAITAPGVAEAITAIRDHAPGSRILICGSLYLAGHVLRENV